jgi:hypothetical protein
VVGGSGGGRPNLAQAGGKDAKRLNEAMDRVYPGLRQKQANLVLWSADFPEGYFRRDKENARAELQPPPTPNHG